MPIPNSIRVEADSAQAGEPTEETTEFGCDVGPVHPSRQVGEKLIRAEIHAGPTFGAEIADDGEIHAGFFQITVNLMPLVVRLTSGQSMGTGGALPGHRFASSTKRSPPLRSFEIDARMQWDR